jgi:hypothetical protein
MTGYVIGPWVRGDRFYGRAELLEALLRPGERIRWVAGCRRVGKTSLLRQLELLAPDRGIAPLVWDLQGADCRDELRLSLEDALLDAVDAADPGGLQPHADTGPAELLAAWCRTVRRRDLEPLLLVDEAEELLTVVQRDADAVAELGGRLTDRDAPWTVITSSVRLERLAESTAGGWLDAVVRQPRLIGPLAPDDSRALVRQDHARPEDRPELGAAAVEIVVDRAGGHPYLLQLLAKRTLELGDADRATAALAADPAVGHMVRTDLELLGPDARRACLAVASGADPDLASGLASRLRGLGLVRDDPATGRPRAGHAFLVAQTS